MKSVVLAVLLCAVLPLIKAACYVEDYGKPVKFCQDTTDKTWHPVGSSWRNSKCVDCDCGAKTMNCCDAMMRPTGYPDKCTVEYDYSTCTFEVFRKVPCTYTGAVGK